MRFEVFLAEGGGKDTSRCSRNLYDFAQLPAMDRLGFLSSVLVDFSSSSRYFPIMLAY